MQIKLYNKDVLVCVVYSSFHTAHFNKNNYINGIFCKRTGVNAERVHMKVLEKLKLTC